ncbi:hypothetical protein [Chitinophaga pinensis]|uniref:Uncharacterized protein n=1 Tax=Chitinophaga pinensis (strain ATCC 43595 / DSM 2588 / LMG 13176 / NBRC 15968 / NCIMB 11800 / UQM 2034) TaxID=485918 RepID=A0A979GPN5_CHIPD|nr:hypothetical protein [Chitinophaga pinensis]ACU60682.1 hypothetical protein Cpin_3215 [Chitinophaga pinensis DSM 2588]
MRKAKVILSAVAMFALVGGALAFKASRIPNVFFSNGTTLTTTTPGGPLVTRTYCTVPFTTSYTTTVNPLVLSTTTTWSTTSLTTRVCPTITVYSTI